MCNEHWNIVGGRFSSHHDWILLTTLSILLFMMHMQLRASSYNSAKIWQTICNIGLQTLDSGVHISAYKENDE
jgi:ribosomal silencing factor RsfS